MMERHSKKELTRLILTALILAGGSLYMPAAEATEVSITTQTPSDTMPTGLKKNTTAISDLDILYATNDNTGIPPIKYTLMFSYSGDDDAWADYSICGGCRYEDIIADSNAEQRTITLTNGKVANVYGGYARGANSNSGYISSGGVVTISGGTVTGDIYGGYSKNGNANTNHVTITGNTFAFTGDGAHAIYGGVGNNNANGNEVTISGGTFGTNVTVYGGWETANNTGGGQATGNTVTINKDNISLKGIYGGVVGLNENSLSPVNSNTLQIGANGITLGTVGIQGVATIKFTSGVDFANIISSNGGQVIASSSTLPVLDFTNATGITSSTNGEITVLTATNNLTGIKAKSALVTTATAIGSGLKIKNGTDSDPTAIGSTGVSVIYEKGVHSVKLVGTNTVKYTIGDGAVNTVTLGEMTWNHTNANNTASGAAYTFGSGTTINASGLTFNNTLVEFDGNPLAGTTQKSMTLLSNAANIAGTISQPTAADKGIVNASFTSEGITYTGAAKGTVSIPNSGGQVIYTLNSGTLSTIDLTGWSTASTVPTNWTKGTSAISVSGSFTAPTLEEGESAEILTAGSNLFSDANIATGIAYNPTAETFEPDSENGVTLSGYKASGVLASSDGTKLLYNYGTKDATNIALGSMTWGTGRSITGTGYTFGNVTGVDATNLAFAFTNDQAGALAASSNMSLLSGATGLTAGKTVTYKNSGTNHTQAVSYSTANGAALSGTLTGTVSTAANAVNYAASSMTLDSIDLSSWNGTASSALPTGWTKNGAISVGGTFTKPTMAAGTSLDILTATSDYFSDANIDAAIAYQSSGAFSNTVNGVTLSGSRAGGVKSTNSGKALTYFAEKNDTNTITLGAMTWGTARTADSTYDFSGVTSINASGLTFTGTATSATASTTLLTGATGLDSATYTINPASNTAVVDAAFTDTNNIAYTGKGNGAVSVDGTDVKFTISGGTVNSINLGNWNWTGTPVTGLLTGWSGTNIAVNTGSFNTQSVTNGTTLFTLTGTDTFSTISGAKAYKNNENVNDDEANGVTFAGVKSGGIKVEDDKVTLKYYTESMNVSNITLGNMTVGAGGTVTPRTVSAGYAFTASTAIDATNLKFDKPENVVNSDLVTGATNVSGTNPITGTPHSQAITNAAIGNGITGSGTLTGTVSADSGTISYTVGGKTLSTMNLSGWNGTTTSLPAGWTGSNVAVNTGSFAAPDAETVIFNSGTAGFFGTVTGDRAYKDGEAVTEAAKNGVALAGTKTGGVKADGTGATLTYYTESMNASTITLGNMTWGTGRDITETGYTFTGVGANGVDASQLTFDLGNTANTIKAGDNMDLVTSATGLSAGLAVKGSPRSQSVSYNVANVATLAGTLTGTVSTAANTVHYEVTGKTLDSVDISKWDGTTTDTAVDASWEKNASGIAVTGSGFKTPTAVGEYNILTAGSTDFFTGAQIDSSIAYQPSGTYSETANNITLSGKQAKGVLASSNGTSLQYKIGEAYIDTIKLGQVAYSKDAVLLDKSSAMYNYSQVTGLDKSGFRVTMTDDQKKTAQAADSMTLVKANGTLNNLGVQDTQNSKYTYTANPGLTVKGTIVTNLTATGGSVLYTVDSNKASDLTVGSVTWNSTYARPGSEIAYSDAIVNAENVTFSGVSTLKKGDTMTLVSNFGTSVNKVRGGIFTLSNGKTGKGHAYWDSATGSLVYVVDRGVDDEVETKTAIGTKTIIINEQPHQGDVPGGEAEGDGEAKDNETIIKKSHIKKNPDGTGGDTNGGTSEDGDADENKLDIEESEIDGDATGGQSDTGNTEDNETIIKKKSIIHGGVAGGETLGGHGGSRRNKTTVEDSTVEGDVDGGKTGGDGDTKDNEVEIKNGSKIGGSVHGGNSGGSGESTGNEADVDGSEVSGDVIGGESKTGDTKDNKAKVKNGSKIGGSVIGGKSGGSGSSTGNEATAEGSIVSGDVIGGYSQTGAVSANKANVNGGKVFGRVFGGKTDGSQAAAGNIVNLEGGATINGAVYGGYSENGTADGNIVTVKNATIRDYIYGGKSKIRSSNDLVYFEDGSVLGIIGGGCNEAISNRVTLLKGSVEEHTIGGFATATATDNTVNILGGTVTGSVIGGYGATTAANENTVNLGGGTVKGNTIASTVLGVTIAGGVYGGYSASGTTQNNTVNLYGTADISATDLYGGNQEATGNDLYVGMLLADATQSSWTGGSQSVQNIANFENINFAVVPWSTSKAALTITDGTASDLSKATVSAKNVAFTGVKTLSVNDSMTLLDQSKAAKQATSLTEASDFTIGMAVAGTGALSRDGAGNVRYNVKSVRASEQTHNTLMGAEAAMTAINVGNDFIGAATEGLSIDENIGPDGIGCYAKIGGGHMQQETGSHVNVNTWNAILALGHKNVQKKSMVQYGAFFEYGRGNYGTYNDNGQRGDGSVNYTGGGLLGKWTKDNGLYVEGSFRAGTVDEDARSLLRDTARAYSYSTSANYMGFHIGVGKQFAVADGGMVDVYGKYIYNRKSGVNFAVAGDNYNLDSVTSQIIRLGARYTMKREKWNYYVDAAYEHELDGKASGRVNNLAIRGADTSGGSFRLELGATLLPQKDSPWNLNLNLTGYAGKKQGIQGGVTVKFMF